MDVILWVVLWVVMGIVLLWFVIGSIYWLRVGYRWERRRYYRRVRE